MKTIIEVVVGATLVLGGLYWAYKRYAAKTVADVKAVITKVEGDL